MDCRRRLGLARVINSQEMTSRTGQPHGRMDAIRTIKEIDNE